MIVHLMNDDKFVDGAMERFELAAPGRNLFLIQTDRNRWDPRRFVPRRYLRQHPELDIVGSKLATPVAAARLGPDVRDRAVAAVVFHSLDRGRLRLIKRIRPDVRVAWFGWGIDYYPTILRDRFPDPDGILGPRTRVLRRELPGGPRPRVRPLDRSAYGRIDLFVPVLRAEWELARELHPWFRPDYLPWRYGSATGERLPIVAAKEPTGVLVGNSAALTNNHLDAFDALASAGRASSFDRVVVPLSYGDVRVRSRIIDEGRRRFGERFIPLTDFLPRPEYEAVLASCHTLVLGHIRQQALGNVSLAVRAGLRLVMHSQSVLRAELERSGLVIDDLDRFAPGPLPPQVVAQNRLAYRAFRRGYEDPAATRRVVDWLLADR